LADTLVENDGDGDVAENGHDGVSTHAVSAGAW